jgi:hypothetical protein
MPKNSASSGMATTVARVSGPRTVTCVRPRCVVTHSSQWLAATERKAGSGTLREVHERST